ncbi:hypothetical protein [Bradyrhizobium sp.]|uniref:hypothetical protein n=1 Tax=Bradyrhizobium sp. TaxID=376 RepID=UPI0025C551D5|nr:hypothetical protein [Bradyrhizobium sp.]
MAVLAVAAGPAFAADMPVKAAPMAPVPYIMNGIVQSNNQISVDFIETNLNYAERLPNGILFDTEKGWFPGVSVTASSMTDTLVQHLYLWGQVSWINGKPITGVPPSRAIAALT